ncbi:hypothetical protein [Photorhabdus luminescens]|nr:hypothetical protein [Photorhabdus luminescens]MCW7762442.1 hypothetical protein [Photorhabdus luminescens subsp. venezuelensis]
MPAALWQPQRTGQFLNKLLFVPEPIFIPDSRTTTAISLTIDQFLAP